MRAIIPSNARFSVLLGGVALGVAFLGGRRKLLEGVDRVVAIGDRRIGRQPHHIETPAHIESERIHADEPNGTMSRIDPVPFGAWCSTTVANPWRVRRSSMTRWKPMAASSSIPSPMAQSSGSATASDPTPSIS